MTGKKKQSGREQKAWAKVYRRPNGAAVHVVIPRRLLEEAEVNIDVPLLVRRTAYRKRKSVVLEFREESKVPERERT